MRIIFVRHGEPDYAHDCLTVEGRRQAQAASLRLQGEGISEIYASPCGRAQETASCTARLLGLPVTTLDYMREISWGGEGIPERGHPWTLASNMIAQEDFDFYSRDWREHPYFRGNAATDYCEMIAGKIDEFMLSHDYKREGSRYLCSGGTDKTVALFSHGGSGACALARLLALPFPYLSAVMPYGFTSVTILDFPVEEGQYVHPRIELFNDCAHIQSSKEGPKLQQESE